MGMKPRLKVGESRLLIPKSRQLVASTLLEDSARVVIANALIEARKSHDAIVQGHCSHCNGKTSKRSACVLCAVILSRGLRTSGDMEFTTAGLLGLSERWVLDLVSGFDKDGEDVQYPAAKNLGARLWRKYGGPTS